MSSDTMSNEERDMNLPPESSPDAGGNSGPLENRLEEQLGDAAGSVTRKSRDLQDEPGAPVGPRVPAGVTDDDKLLSMLSWLSMAILSLPIVPLILLISENTKNRSYQRHHAITGLLFYAAAIVYELVAGAVFGILTTVPLVSLAACLCLWVIFFVPHALSLYYAFQAYSGKRIELPYLTAFGRRQGWL